MPGRSSELKSPGMKIPDEPLSQPLFWYLADWTPNGIEIRQAMITAAKVNRIVGPRPSKIICITGCPVLYESPRFPWKKFLIQVKYWIYNGWSRPSFIRCRSTSAAEIFWLLSNNSNGLPDAIEEIKKTRTVIPKKVGIAIKARRNTYFFILFLPSID